MIKYKRIFKEDILNEIEIESLAVALYVINKEAKVIRDERNEIKQYLFYDEENRYTLYHPYSDKPLFGREIRKEIPDEISDAYREESLQEDIATEAEEEGDEARAEEARDEAEFQAGVQKTLKGVLKKWDDLHDRLNSSSKWDKANYYDLKDKVLKKLQIKPVDYHVFENKDIRPLYEFGGFSFHGVALTDDEIEKLRLDPNDLEELDEIPAINKLAKGVNINNAVKILQEYLKI
jgi:hypothetical protein